MSAAIASPVRRSRSGERQVLTLTLSAGPSAADQVSNFGLNLLQVCEIRGFTPPTPYPNTARHVLGAVNLRGSIIPVIDLRLRFGATEVTYTKFTVIIVVTLSDKLVGLVADSVSDVLTVQDSEMMPAPDIGIRAEDELISGIAKMGDIFVLMLNLEKLLQPDGILDEPAAEPATEAA